MQSLDVIVGLAGDPALELLNSRTNQNVNPLESNAAAAVRNSIQGEIGKVWFDAICCCVTCFAI
jgi:hypothetical protein